MSTPADAVVGLGDKWWLFHADAQQSNRNTARRQVTGPRLDADGTIPAIGPFLI